MTKKREMRVRRNMANGFTHKKRISYRRNRTRQTRRKHRPKYKGGNLFDINAFKEKINAKMDEVALKIQGESATELKELDLTDHVKTNALFFKFVGYIPILMIPVSAFKTAYYGFPETVRTEINSFIALFMGKLKEKVFPAQTPPPTAPNP